MTVAIALAGCQSGYRAATLPAEYCAPQSDRAAGVHLDRMARPGFGSSRIAAGDLLEITVVTGADDEKPIPVLARVANDGTVSVPLIGTVPVAGLEPFEASQNVMTSAVERGIYLQPVVTLDVKTRAVNRITVLGAVTNPGTHELPRGSSDLLSAIAAAGGLTDEAGRNVEVLKQSSLDQLAARTRDLGTVQVAAYESAAPLAHYPDAGPSLAEPTFDYVHDHSAQAQQQASAVKTSAAAQTIHIDLANAAGANPSDYQLGDRDVVMVRPKEKRPIYVTGLVEKAGRYELPGDQDVYLLDALAMAGGLSSPVADKVLVIRPVDGQEPLRIKASVSKAKRNTKENLRLAPGDMVSVEQTISTTVVDTLTDFFRVSVGLASGVAVF